MQKYEDKQFVDKLLDDVVDSMGGLSGIEILQKIHAIQGIFENIKANIPKPHKDFLAIKIKQINYIEARMNILSQKYDVAQQKLKALESYVPRVSKMSKGKIKAANKERINALVRFWQRDSQRRRLIHYVALEVNSRYMRALHQIAQPSSQEISTENPTENVGYALNKEKDKTASVGKILLPMLEKEYNRLLAKQKTTPDDLSGHNHLESREDFNQRLLSKMVAQVLQARPDIAQKKAKNIDEQIVNTLNQANNKGLRKKF